MVLDSPGEPSRAPESAAPQPLQPMAVAGTLSWLLFAASALVVYSWFKPYAPADRLAPLAVYAAIYMVIWAVLDGVLIIRPPRSAAEHRFWHRAVIAVMVGADIACIWVVWVIAPYGPMELRMMVVVLMMAHVPAQILSSPENVAINRLGIVVVIGSTIALTALHGGRLGQLLGLYLLGFAAMMYLLSNVVRHTVSKTVAARDASDETAVRLEQLLATVSAERDAKTRFIAAASHDLGQPLQAAALFFDQVIQAQTAAQRTTAADGVRRAFASAQQLLSHMLSHLRLEADIVEPQYSRVSLGTAMHRVARQYAPAAKAAGMRIRIVQSRETVRLDPALLDRALGNLVANAIRHSGGRRVLLGVRQYGVGAVRLWVIDDGVGISQADAPHVFEDYFQGSDSRAPVGTGFGLGLASVRRVAQLMGGQVGLEPRLNRGAAFYMTFLRPEPTRANAWRSAAKAKAA